MNIQCVTAHSAGPAPKKFRGCQQITCSRKIQVSEHDIVLMQQLIEKVQIVCSADATQLKGVERLAFVQALVLGRSHGPPRPRYDPRCRSCG